jgi:hypothetical protein
MKTGREKVGSDIMYLVYPLQQWRRMVLIPVNTKQTVSCIEPYIVA